MGKFDLVSSLHALPETDPVEIEGIQFGGGCGNTCQSVCLVATLNVLQTVCIIAVTACH
ncbi:MAG: VenA family class IV lanthipeptide [Pseudonocardiaceae bacterium]